jgi:hypothetical protein
VVFVLDYFGYVRTVDLRTSSVCNTPQILCGPLAQDPRYIILMHVHAVMAEECRRHIYVLALLQSWQKGPYHYWNFCIRWVPGSSPRAKTQALGKLTDAESTSRQQAYLGKHNILPRVGKGTFCREPSSRRTAKCYHVAHPAVNDGTVTVALLYQEPFSAKLRLYLHSY